KKYVRHPLRRVWSSRSVQNRVFAAGPCPFIRFSRKPCCTGREVLATLSQTTGFLRASAIEVEDRSGARRSCGNSFVQWRRESELRSTSMADVSPHVFHALEKRRYRIQGHAGAVTPFNLTLNLGRLHTGGHS